MAETSRVLVVGDLHCPVMHPDYPGFLLRIKRKYKCSRVVFIGDVVDWHSMSYHERDPNLHSAGNELNEARAQVAVLRKMFPVADVLTGNHDELPSRQARTAGMPVDLLKHNVEIFDTPNWTWHPRISLIDIDGVKYAHGDRGKGGDFAAMKNAILEGSSYVQGHVHTQGGVWWFANESRLIFGMNVGCGIDRHAAAMAYGRGYAKKPLVGCGVVLDGTMAIFEPMILGGAG